MTDNEETVPVAAFPGGTLRRVGITTAEATEADDDDDDAVEAFYRGWRAHLGN